MILLIAGSIGGISYLLTFEQIKNSQQERLRVSVQALSANTYNYLENKKNSLIKMASGRAVERYWMSPSIETLGGYLKDFFSDFIIISLIGDTGNEVFKISGNRQEIDELDDLSDLPLYFIATKQPNSVHISAPRYSKIIDAMVLDFFYKHVSFFDEELGFLKAVVQISDLVEKLNEISLGTAGFFVLLDQQGNIIYPFLDNVSSLKEDQSTSKALVGLLSVEEIDFEKYKLLGQDSFVSTLTIPDYGWKMLVALPLSEALIPLHKFRNQIAFFSFCVIIVGIALSYLLGRSISRPIGLLTRTVRSIAAKGDLTQRVDLVSKNEMGQLAASFNHMLAGLFYLERVVSSMSDMLIVIDADARIRMVNPVTLKLLGYTEEQDLIGKSISVVLDPIDSKTKVHDLIQQGFAGTHQETHYLSREGDKIPVSFSGSVLLDESDRLQGVVCVAQDMTERKKAQLELETQRTWLQVTLSSIGDAIITTDKQGMIIFMNPVAEELTGWPLQDARGRSADSVFHIINEQTRQVAESPIHRVIEEGLVVGLANHTILIARDGRELPIDDSGAPIKDQHGELQGVVLVFRDFSERRNTERALLQAKTAAEAATKAKSEFLATMSHEIRTPMNGVIGMTSLLMNTTLTPQQREFVDVIRTSSDHLLSIINDILDFSKIEAGLLELEEQPFELNTAIEDVLVLFASKALEKKVELLHLVDSEVPPFIMGDITRLRQILANLLSNAIKFTDQGEIYVFVKIEEQSTDTVTLQFSVKDTGVGIPADKIDHILEAFFQADLSTTRKYGGSGLGLAICSRLAQLMGGRVWVESTEGLGSTFYFTIQTRMASAAPRRYLKPVPELENKSVLIVDDNLTNLRILELECRHWKMLPRTTTSAADVLDWLGKKHQFDLVILDMHMPSISGLELGRKIRRLYPKTDLPVVLLSSVDTWNEYEEIKEIFSAYVTRPVKRADLFDMLLRVLADKNAVEEQIPQSTEGLKLAEILPMKILIAEDNRINQTVALHFMEEMGYQADVAANGHEVFEALKRQHYDLIFMDIQMPVMDGLETARNIVKNWSIEHRPVIVAMTANVMPEDKQTYLDAGMNDYLAKPVALEQMRVVLERWGKVIKAKHASATFI